MEHSRALRVTWPHGVQVESEVSKGSTFTVWLPVHPDKRLLRTALVRLSHSCALVIPCTMLP